jgi:hypothetical protein
MEKVILDKGFSSFFAADVILRYGKLVLNF